MMKSLVRNGNQLGIFFVLLFLLCFAWQWLNPVHQELHMQLLEISFWGYTGMNALSFILGLIQSYIWGYIGVILWGIANIARLKS
jgi:hypothetical protein